MERDQVLAFRLARHRLARRDALTLADAARCPISDFSPNSALLGLAARARDVSRSDYDRAVDTGELVVAPTQRAALHAVDPHDFALYGRDLLAEREDELAAQLGPQVRGQLAESGIGAPDALAEVTAGIRAALAGARRLSKDELHAHLRGTVRAELLPWCGGCGSHHVAPMLWRFAGVAAGMRCDSSRRFLLGAPETRHGRAEVVRRFLRHYGPSTPSDFTAWAGLARSHGRRLWSAVEPELAEIRLDGRRTWLLAADTGELDSPPQAGGVRLLPPRDPYLTQPDRATLVQDPALRRRLFRPVADPGAVLVEGRLSGLWRARAAGGRLEVSVQELAAIPRETLQEEAERIAAVRELGTARVSWDGPF